MTDKEIYGLIAFKNNIHDELRIVQRADMVDMNSEKLNEYLKQIAVRKPNFAKLGNERMLQDLGIIALDDKGVYRPTVAGLLCFGIYPQSLFPQWIVTCISVPGYEIGEVGGLGERFIDNKKIDGTIPEMIEGCMSFLLKNISVRTIINNKTGKREDRAEYPANAIREAILNALLHRDYSIHSEGVYVQMRLYKDRIEIQNPGGLFGRISIEEIGKRKNYDARNPNLIRIVEDIGLVENRGSGIPTMIDEMINHGLTAPDFEDIRGDFIVSFYGYDENINDDTLNDTINDTLKDTLNSNETNLIEIIRENPKITTERLSQSLEVSIITVKRYLKKLQDNRTIMRVGSKKSGYWEIIK